MSALDILKLWHGLQTAKDRFLAASPEEKAAILGDLLDSQAHRIARIAEALPPVAAGKLAELVDALREWR